MAALVNWCRYLLVAVWVTLVGLKLVDNALPGVGIVAGVALFEGLAAVLLLTRHWRAGATLSLLLGIGFSLSIPASIAFGLDFSECGCTGPVQAGRLGRFMIAVGVAALSLGTLWRPKG